MTQIEPTTSTFVVRGMDCAEEEAVIRKRLESLEGVEEVQFNLLARKLTVRHRSTPDAILQALKGIGVEASLETTAPPRQPLWRKHRLLVLTLVSAVLIGGATVLHVLGVSSSVTVPMYTAAMLSAGWFIAGKGIRAARRLALDMNFLMSLATVGAAILGEWLEGATVIFLFAVAELLESYSLERARQAIRALMELTPKMALVRRNGQQSSLPVEEVRIGDEVLVKPGQKIPVDGVVLEGASSVNQASITGESLPVDKGPGDPVFAGTVNHEGALVVRTTKLAQDTTLARIIHRVEEAQAHRAPSQRFVDRFARIYTPAVVSAALVLAVLPPLVLGAAFSTWFYRALVLLVTACPCALVISTPVTIISGLTAAARRGVLIKGGVHLENAARLRVIAFDKTGTLTQGVPRVVEVIAVDAQSADEVLRLAAALEARSEHPLAKAISAHARARGLSSESVEEFQSLPGRGAKARVNGETYFVGNHRLFEEKGLCSPEIDRRLEALEREGKTAVLLGREGKVLGVITLADEIRKESFDSLPRLRGLGIAKIVLLTGDNRGTAEAIARRLGIEEFHAELLPEDKLAVVRHLADRYGKVAMVGDGVNDAPALAAATLGIAMGTAGTDQALETADVALMADDLTKLPLVIHLSRRTMRIIKQNIAFSILVKGTFVALAPLGLATLWMAVGADMGASLLVIVNGLRLLRSDAVSP